MQKLQICVLDLVCKGPTNTLWARIMHANLASIMPQVIATWCEQEGHQVTMICYTGSEDLSKEIPSNVDLLFISSFTQAALLAYAISNYARSKGAVTVLGGPHARCYPDDAIQYFDYVLGFTNRLTIMEVLSSCTAQRPVGKYLSAGKQPADLCGVRERWKFIEPTLQKAPFLKIVPMLGSVGCPYTCPFCIDASVPYQSLDFQVIKEDLRFLLEKFKRPWVAWHDPNFGIRFEENMEAIASAAPPKSFRFIAESSLSVVTEQRVKVLQDNGFMALLPGIESWFDLGNKSKTGRITGDEKVRQVSDHVNMIFGHIPYVQTNFVLGLDSDSGTEPFELTKRFIDRTPQVFPGYSLLTAFGEAAPLNLEYQQAGRVLPFPFHFLNNHLAMNIKPKNYDWVDFYDKVIDLTAYSFSPKALYKRFKSASNFSTRWMNLMRAVSSEGYGRLRFFRQVRKNLISDKSFRAYFEGESKQLPPFYYNVIKKDLGVWWEWLPEKALLHNENAYYEKTSECKICTAPPVKVG
ncbi:radical SAM protein [Paraflavitalea sp. CAU 1676]|uniref:B12-binding domain-containing radical SAM protein n=1 Tax=Paraflavitalea sp. CAU 1676 TaxID=3032598 RepID=UPI0023DB93CB|nr:radical SAM protein [Paraflavitalea sp. CAU 1676]MDF2187968.1 radical SAM protein [Paraflavitalea sp. CAU 1676]